MKTEFIMDGSAPGGWHSPDMKLGAGKCAVCGRRLVGHTSNSDFAQRLGRDPKNPGGPAVDWCRKCWRIHCIS